MAIPLVSVCVPCHNAAPYIAQTIESLLSQTWTNLEVIIINDSSTDGTAEVLSGFQLPQVKISHSDYENASRSRNAALMLAQGEWIKFFDADDLLSCRSIEDQLNRLDNRLDAIASARWGRFSSHDLAGFQLSSQGVWRDMNSLDWLVEACRDAQPMMQPGLFLMHRALLDKTGGWDESLSLIDDFEFYARVICCASDVLFAPNATLYYRSGLSSSLSSQKSRKAAVSALNSLIKGTAHLLDCRSDLAARQCCANLMQNYIYTFFPAYPDLLLEASQRAADLGGCDLPPPGGPLFQRTSRMIGWKAARRLQCATGRF